MFGFGLFDKHTLVIGYQIVQHDMFRSLFFKRFDRLMAHGLMLQLKSAWLFESQCLFALSLSFL